MKLTRLVASTTMSERDFWNRSLLGRSLLAFPDVLRPKLRIHFENHGSHGLSEIYNSAIDACPSSEHILFVHDDVWIHDLFLQHRIAQGLAKYDVIGLAGSRGSDPKEPSWGLAFDENLRPTGWQSAPDPSRPIPELGHGGEALHLPPAGVKLSGAVSHVSRYVEPGVQNFSPTPALSLYGTFPSECDLLDGLFLAADVERLRLGVVRFDERFSFHLYDLDFCRSARAKNLKLGTWPILVSHGSAGNFDTEEFRAAARLYLQKWAPPSKTCSLQPAAGAPRAFPGDGVGTVESSRLPSEGVRP